MLEHGERRVAQEHVLAGGDAPRPDLRPELVEEDALGVVEHPRRGRAAAIVLHRGALADLDLPVRAAGRRARRRRARTPAPRPAAKVYVCRRPLRPARGRSTCPPATNAATWRLVRGRVRHPARRLPGIAPSRRSPSAPSRSSRSSTASPARRRRRATIGERRVRRRPPGTRAAARSASSSSPSTAVQSRRLPPAYASQSARFPATAMSVTPLPVEGPSLQSASVCRPSRYTPPLTRLQSSTWGPQCPLYGPERNATE